MPFTHVHAQPVARVEARDHRVQRFDRERVERVRIERERSWNRIHPIIISHATWTPAQSYAYQPAIQLLGPTALASGELAIDTGSLGSSSALELDAAGTGSTYVSQLVIYTVDGGSQVLPVNQLLSASNPSVRLPIDNCAGIARIVIDGHSSWGGLLGMRAV